MNHNKKIKVLLVVRWPVGGIRTFIRYVYRQFEPELYQFTILGPDHPEIDILGEDLKDLNVDIKKIDERPSSYEFFKSIFKVIRSGKYDLVHSHGFTSGILTALPAFMTSTPHILTSHDVLSEVQFRGFVGQFKKIGMRIAFSMIGTIHSVSYDAQANLLEYFPSLSKVLGKCIVIRNGIEIERFVDIEPRDLRTEIGVDKDTFLVGFLGRFMSQKGFIYLVDAIEWISKLNNLSIKPIVVTFGESGFIREEKLNIIERGLGDYFRYLPFTPNVASVIKSLDVVVIPSLWEACPLLPMEVLVVGTPLIATNCVGLREVLRDTPAYIVPTKNGKALAEGIELFIKNDYKEMFKSYSKEASKNYDVTLQAFKIKQLVSERLIK